MTNGEKLCIDFPNMRYTISEHRVVTTIGVAASFDLDWWNAEYKESITKNGISNKSIIYKAKESKEIQKDLDKLSELNKTATKNDLGVDCISRQAAIDACQSKKCATCGNHSEVTIIDRLFCEPCKETTDVASIEEESVVLLDKFTKVFCRIPNDYEEYGDLKFRCKECPFENHDTGICTVKQFKCKYAPNYVDFGAMGDL